MMVWIVALFASGFGVAINLSRLVHGTPDYKMAGLSVILNTVLGLYCGYAICHNQMVSTSQSNIDKIFDQFVKSWDRISQKLSSGRWVLTIVAAVAFFMFCDAVCKILVTAADKLPDTTVVALFMFLASIIQGVVKDYFHMDRSDAENSNDNGNSGPQGPQGVK